MPSNKNVQPAITITDKGVAIFNKPFVEKQQLKLKPYLELSWDRFNKVLSFNFFERAFFNSFQVKFQKYGQAVVGIQKFLLKYKVPSLKRSLQQNTESDFNFKDL